MSELVAKTEDLTISDANSEKPKTTQSAQVRDMTERELVHMIQEQEYRKQKERYDRYMKKQQGMDMEDAKDKEHKFWDTQPVPHMGDTVEDIGPINNNTNISEVKPEPYNMPAGFEWCSVDVSDSAQALEVYTLLTENYVEDDDCNFRFDYSVSFLQWALMPPGYIQDWHVGVRNSKTNQLMGFITGVPATVRVDKDTIPMAEINFLCVHKKLRSKRLAPVLIKEITRRVNVHGRWQATYTAGVVLPKPVARCRYWHRSLNPKKLIEIKFSSLPQKTTMARHLKELKLPDRPAHDLRPTVREDIPAVLALLNASHVSKKLVQVFHEEELAHILLSRKGVVNSYVLENEAKEITDFCSFYHLPSTVMKSDKHSKLNAVYSYYNAATTMPLQDLMLDALILARKEDADVFNALDLGENGPTLKPLLFGEGDGFLQYYLYNWKHPQMQNTDIGVYHPPPNRQRYHTRHRSSAFDSCLFIASFVPTSQLLRWRHYRDCTRDVCSPDNHSDSTHILLKRLKISPNAVMTMNTGSMQLPPESPNRTDEGWICTDCPMFSVLQGAPRPCRRFFLCSLSRSKFPTKSEWLRLSSQMLTRRAL